MRFEMKRAHSASPIHLLSRAVRMRLAVQRCPIEDGAAPALVHPSLTGKYGLAYT